jgi:serine/threonine protein kinase
MPTANQIGARIRLDDLKFYRRHPVGEGSEPDPYYIGPKQGKENPPNPRMWSGGFAVVFPASKDHDFLNNQLPDKALRFFMAKTPRHYSSITSFLSQNSHPSLVEGKLFPKAMELMGGERVDMMEMDFVNGLTLDDYVDQVVSSGQSADLADTAEVLRRTVNELMELGFYHGDLSHSNIMIGNDGTLKLIDYDSVFLNVPGVNNPSSGEAGNHYFQHPSRRNTRFTRGEDVYFSALGIYVSLHAIAKEPGLWKFHDEDTNLIFEPKDLNSTNTELWRKIDSLSFDQEIEACVATLKFGIGISELVEGDFVKKIEGSFAKGGSGSLFITPILPPTRPKKSPKPPKTEVVRGSDWMKRVPSTDRVKPLSKKEIQKGLDWKKKGEGRLGERVVFEGKNWREAEPLGHDMSHIDRILREREEEPDLELEEVPSTAMSEPSTLRLSRDTWFVIDASNIVKSENPYKTQTLLDFFEHLESLGFNRERFAAIADAPLRYQVRPKEGGGDEGREFEELLATPNFTQSAKGVPADKDILTIAYAIALRGDTCKVVTDDWFRDHQRAMPNRHKWFKENHLQFTHIAGVWSIDPDIVASDEEE